MNGFPRGEPVLVTGHTGFTGRHMVDYLLRLPRRPKLVGLARRAESDCTVDEQVVADLRQSEVVRQALLACRPEVIVHLAGSLPPAGHAELWDNNVLTTEALLAAVRSCPELRPRVLAVGSAAEYGPADERLIDEQHPCAPTTAYGRAKLAATSLCVRYAREYGLSVVVARPFNLLGPGMTEHSVVGTLCAQLVSPEGGGRVELGNLNSSRDFVDVGDAVAAYWALARLGRAGEVYNVCSGRAVTVRELIDLAASVSGRAVHLRSVSERHQIGDVEYSCGSYAKLEELTGWRPRRELATSIADVLADFQRRLGCPAESGG